MAGNANLNAAAKARKDEFYTQLTDIEKELRHYKRHFQGKTVLCNCDDPFESNFFKYFVLNFNRLGLKKLLATCYAGSPIANQQLSLFDVTGEEENKNRPYKAVVTQVYDKTGDGGVDMLDVAALFKSGENELTELAGDGDFRSPECLALLDEADIVVTNPPFSLFREYVATLMAHAKKFVIIAPKNALHYKEIFPLIKENKIWVGATPMSTDLHFMSPKSYIDTLIKDSRPSGYVIENGTYLTRSPSIWLTNLDLKKRHEEMILVKRYKPECYPKYDNYEAIEVASTSEIPLDYSGVMGVPITFLDKYSPEQFEIVGMSDRDSPFQTKVYTKDDTPKYSDFNRCCTIREKDGSLKSTYMRILIRNFHPEEG